MPSRQVIWARKKRAELLAALGGRCRRCGAEQDLEFDCIEPQGHAHHSVGFVGRTTFYRLEWMRGNLQVLCAGCHGLKTAADLLQSGSTTVREAERDQPY